MAKGIPQIGKKKTSTPVEKGNNTPQPEKGYDVEKEKAKWQSRINSKNAEIKNWSSKLAKLQATQITEAVMGGLQGGYADVEDGDTSEYTFQSKGPLGSQPELGDEGFDTFYGDSDSQWGSYDFDSDGPELGEDPETLGEDRYQVNYSNTLEEKFASKAQQKYLYATNPEAAKKLGSKMTKKDYKKLPEKKKKKRVKELQVWGVNTQPGFGLGDFPRTPMYSDVPGPAHSDSVSLEEIKKPKMKKGKLLEYISELTTRAGSNGKIYKKKDLTKESAPFSVRTKSLDEIKKMINRVMEAPIDYGDRPERINPGIESKLASQDTPFGQDHPAFPKVGDDEVYSNYEELIASKRFKDVVDTFKRYTGVEGNVTDMQNLMGLQGMMMQSLQNTLRIESANKTNLEELAIDIVTKDLNVPEGSLQFDVEITGMQKLSKDDMKQKPKDEEDSFEMEEETLEHMEELDLEVSKRRFINSMMQGSAKKSLYLYHMVSDELNAIDPTLMNLYGVVISANDLMYWIMPDMMMGRRRRRRSSSFR